MNSTAATDPGRFEIIDRLGGGGQASVWRARLRSGASQPFVALKIFKPGRLSEQNLYRLFESEVVQTARLNHPNIITICEHGVLKPGGNLPEECRGGGPFLVTEYASGGPLSPGTERSWEEVQPLLESVLTGLAYAHARGIVHRDLKPDNLLFCCTDSKHPVLKIADFGLAVASGHLDDSIAPLPGRSPRYAAPEQAVAARWRELGPWTDLYAVGRIAYALLAGQDPPRDADLPLHSLSAPPQVIAWIRAMTAHDPSDRIARAADAQRALAHAQATTPVAVAAPQRRSGTTFFSELEPAAPVLAEAGYAERMPGAPPQQVGVPAWVWRHGAGLLRSRHRPLIGRGDEQSLLWMMLEGVIKRQRPGAVVIRGVEGSGRRSLARWLHMSAHEVGVAETLECRYSNGMSSLTEPGRMLGRWLRVLGLGDDQRRARIVAELERLDWPDEARGEDTLRIEQILREVEQGEVGVISTAGRHDLLARFLGALAAQRPVVVVLEDAMAGDAEGLCARLLTESAPILVLLTTTTTALAEALGGAEIALEPLRRAPMSALVDGLLPLDRPLHGQVVEQSRGLPLLAVHTAYALLEAGDLLLNGLTFYCTHASLQLPEDVQAFWLRRLDLVLAPLGEGARGGMWAAAALGQRLDEPEWQRLCHRLALSVDLDALVEVLSAAGVWDREAPGTQGWRFASALVWEGLRQEAAGTPLWEEINGICAEQVEIPPARRGAHLLAAGRPAESLAPLLAASRQLMRLTDYPAVRATLSLLEAALADCPDEAGVRIDVGLLRGQLALGQGGSLDDARADAKRTVRRALRREDAQQQSSALRLLGMIEQRRGELLVAEALLRWAGEVADRAGLAQERCRCTLQRGTNRVMRGVLSEALPLLGDALAQARALGTAVEIADACQELGLALMRSGELDEAEEKLTEAGAGYRSLQRIASEAQVELALGELYKERRERERARDMWTRSSRRYSRILSNKRAYPLVNLSMLALRDDRITDARELLREARQLIARSGDTTLPPYCHAGLALVAACDGDRAAAGTHLGAVGASPPPDGDIAWLAERTGHRLRAVDAHTARKAWALALGIYRRLGDKKRAATVDALLQI